MLTSTHRRADNSRLPLAPRNHFRQDVDADAATAEDDHRTGQQGRCAAQNAFEVARFGGLATDEEPSPYEVTFEHRVFRLRRYYGDRGRRRRPRRQRDARAGGAARPAACPPPLRTQPD